jgi:hypothetical protein
LAAGSSASGYERQTKSKQVFTMMSFTANPGKSSTQQIRETSAIVMAQACG